MNRALQWKLITGFLLVFIAGGMTGAFLGAAYARHLFFEFHHDPGVMSSRMRDRLRTELNLTPEQVAKISPIIDKTAAQLAEIRRDTGRRVHEVMTNAHREMAANLTDDQRLKLQEIESRRHRWQERGLHRHGGFPPPESPAAESSPQPQLPTP